jgi:hypothetical protein
MEHSVPSVKGLVDSAPADLVPLVFAVTTVNVASGDSLIAGRVSAMGVRMSVIPTQALAWAAVITRGASTVKGEPRAATVVGGWAGCLQITLIHFPTGALLVFMGTHGCHMGASAGLVPALKALGASDTLLLLATGMDIPSKLCASVEKATQVSGQDWV